MFEDSDIEQTLDGAAAFAVAVWLFMVWYQGNTKQMFSALFDKSNLGYIEWMIAIVLLWQLLKIKSLQPVSGYLVSASILAIVIRIFMKNDGNEIIGKFAKGQIGLFGLVQQLIGSK